jgi:hypothetical protein
MLVSALNASETVLRLGARMLPLLMANALARRYELNFKTLQ